MLSSQPPVFCLTMGGIFAGILSAGPAVGSAIVTALRTRAPRHCQGTAGPRGIPPPIPGSGTAEMITIACA